MAGIPKGGFETGGQLEKWLKGLPEEVSRNVAIAIAVRASLRASVFADRFPMDIGDRFGNFLLAIFHANMVSRTTLMFPTRETIIATKVGARSAFRARADADTLTFTSSPFSNVVAAAAFAARSVTSVPYVSDAEDAIIAAANAAAMASANAAAYATFWAVVTTDARMFERTLNPTYLLDLPIWPDGTPLFWTYAKSDFDQTLFKLDTQMGDGWTVWKDWYDSIAAGKNSFSLPTGIAAKLDQRIALGDGRRDFWDREPIEINREIASWVEVAKQEALSTLPVFISYNEADKKAAIDIGDVIESAGFRVFAQYKDMMPGDNFVRKMQVGLSIMGKFAPVYSPEYIASDICQDEWSAAYNMDRGGKRRLIVGYLVKPTELQPLQKQVCYVPLYGLSKPQARKAILDALLSDGQMADAHESRRRAAELASPAPTINADGKIDIDPDAEAEQQFVDNELAKLPESLRKLIGQILDSAADRNLPSIIKSPLQDYRTELRANGAAPRIADLQRSIEIVKAEYDDAIVHGDGWLRGGLKKALEQLFQLHEQLRQRFPLFVLRDFELARSPIDPARFDDPKFGKAHSEFTKSIVNAEKEGLATEELRRVSEWRESQRKDIASLREHQSSPEDIFLTDQDRLTPATIKKRFLYDVSGTSDRLIDRVEKVTSIADSSVGKAVIGSVREVLKLIWMS